MQHDLKIMVVDDSPLQAEILESILENIGINSVTKTLNGLDAMEHFKEALQVGAPYSLIFLDIVMPEMDGQEVLKRMRTLEKEAGVKENDKTTIIMITSLSSPTDMITALLEGDCTDYVVKPVAENVLQAMLVKYGLIA